MFEDEEYINFESITNERGIASITFENEEAMYVGDSPAYYEISKDWVETECSETGISTFKGSMSREDYARICVDYNRWELED